MWNHRNLTSLGMTVLYWALALSAWPVLGADPVTIQAAEAFINGDPGQGSGTALTLADETTDKVVQIGTGSLSKPGGAGPHVLSMRFQDDGGEWSEPVKIGFPVYATTHPSSNNVKAMEAFVDNDSGTAFSGIGDDSLVEKPPVINFDISGLDAGVHVVSMRARDSADQWSEPVKIGFPVYATTHPSSNNVKAMEAFVDSDSGTAFSGIGDDSLVEKPPVINFDISGLDAGVHVVSMRARDSADQWSEPVKIGFPIYQPPDTPPNRIDAMEGFIGYPPPSAGSGTAFTGVFDNVVKRETGHVHIINLPQGVYPYGARVRDTSGEWSDIVTMVFEFIDTDGDGVPDAYEDAHGMNKDDPTDAGGDLDSDKFTNLDEYIFDSDPNGFFDRPTGDTSCSSGLNDVMLTNDFYPGKYLCIGTTSITGEAIKIWDGAYIYLRSPVVELKQEVTVENGATVRARTVDLIP